MLPSRTIHIMDRDDLRILEIEHVKMEDSGLYRITLENEYGRIETTARLDVICNRRRSTRMARAVSASPRRPYHWTRRLRGNSTAIGGRLALATDIRGKSLPPTTKRFYCNGEEVLESDRIKIVGRGGCATQLVIDPVMKCDEGVYMCVAEFADCDGDPVVMVSSTEYLKFDEREQSDLKFRKALDSQCVVEEGAEVDLICQVEGSAMDYEYHWLKDGKLVPNGEDFLYIDHGSGVIALRFTDPFVLDSGKYTCVVQTDDGVRVESSCAMEVVEKTEGRNERPEFVKPPNPVYTRSGSDVTFGCRITPVEAEVQWLVNGVVMTNELDGVAVRKR